jgi:hypothetical protein
MGWAGKSKIGYARLKDTGRSQNTGPLTISRASTDVPCLIQHGVDLALVQNVRLLLRRLADGASWRAGVGG